MQANLLHVIAVVGNPVRWKSRIVLARAFIQHMLDSGTHVTLVECAYGERPHELSDIKNVNYVPVRAKTLVWNKENLVNIGISRLPESAKYIAWIDADVTFRKPDWAYETVHALQQYDIVQPWSECYDLGPNDEHIGLHRSFCKLVHHDKPIVQGPKAGPGTGYEFAHPGYAWGGTRRALALTGGLIETGAAGAADHHMALALIGRVNESVHGGLTPAYSVPLHQWQARAMQHINGNIGYVPGTIEHGWHGRKDDRAYVDRWDILVRSKFDPSVDLIKNLNGVIELAGNKPGLRHEMDRYFRQRNEDVNAL